MSTIVSDSPEENSNSNRCEGDVVVAPRVSCIIVVLWSNTTSTGFVLIQFRPGSVINVNHCEPDREISYDWLHL